MMFADMHVKPLYEIKVVGSGYIAKLDDDVLVGSAENGIVEITLPDVTLCKGKLLNIKDGYTKSGTTILPVLGQEIDTLPALGLFMGQSCNIISDGYRWWLNAYSQAL